MEHRTNQGFLTYVTFKGYRAKQMKPDWYRSHSWLWGFLFFSLCLTLNTTVVLSSEVGMPGTSFYRYAEQRKQSFPCPGREPHLPNSPTSFHLCHFLSARRSSLYLFSTSQAALACWFPTSIFMSLYHRELLYPWNHKLLIKKELVKMIWTGTLPH